MTTSPRPINSPEFQFWNSGSLPSPPTLHSADQIFSHGFLLPLHSLLPELEPEPEPSASIMFSSNNNNPILSTSKRWKDFIFKPKPNKTTEFIPTKQTPEKLNTTQSLRPSDKRRRRKNENIANILNENNTSTKNSNSGSAELNINIWPFSRSRSAGNNAARSRPAGSTGRKVSSAPCSRSNSSGESKSRRSPWPNSPGRTGVHLSRSSPVWQPRKARPGWSGKGRVNRPRYSGCGSEGGDGNNGNLFSFRGLFGKRRVLTI